MGMFDSVECRYPLPTRLAPLAFAQWPHREMPSAEENRARREREQECLTGRTLWLWWGGRETGHPVTVIAENNRQLVVQTADKRFQIVDRFSRDQTLFDSEQDGRHLLEERQAKRERQRREYEDAIQNRTQAAADSAKNSISRAESE